MSIPYHTRISKPVTVMINGAEIHATLATPDDAHGLVIFAHASDNSRNSPSTMQLASILNDASLATLACDLLTPEEEVLSEITGEFRYDTKLLSDRLGTIMEWCAAQPILASLPIGILAAGTAAVAALVVAATPHTVVRGLVLRAGRLDLAWRWLPLVEVPTLLVAGALDTPVVVANELALRRIVAKVKQTLVVPGAGHLFLEPGAREQLGEHAARWLDDAFGFGTGELASLAAEIC